MVEKENQHMPHPDYLNRLRRGDLEVGARTEAVDWIWKVGFNKDPIFLLGLCHF